MMPGVGEVVVVRRGEHFLDGQLVLLSDAPDDLADARHLIEQHRFSNPLGSRAPTAVLALGRRLRHDAWRGPRLWVFERGDVG